MKEILLKQMLIDKKNKSNLHLSIFEKFEQSKNLELKMSWTWNLNNEKNVYLT